MKLRGNTNHRLRHRRRGRSHVLRHAAEVAFALSVQGRVARFMEHLTRATSDAFKTVADGISSTVRTIAPLVNYIRIEGTITDAPASEHEEA